MQPRNGFLFPVAIVVTALAVTTVASSVHAQASFVELFDDVGPTGGGDDGPQNLISAGWVFSNQSDPAGSESWFDGGGSVLAPQDGAGYLAVDSLSADFFGGAISNWAVLPAAPDQQAGDTLTFWVRALDSSNADTLQVRYSPSGGTDTGSGTEDVGDFTQMLIDLEPLPTSGWSPVSIDLPGSGRVALRYYVAWACNFTCFTSHIGIDTLSVGEPPPPPCNLPPLPPAGGTVTWTLADSPYRVCSDIVIPATGTAIVEPGVVIDIDPGNILGVDGTLQALGTAESPVTFTGSLSLVTPPLNVHGLADLRFTNIACRAHANPTSAMLISDSTITGAVSTDDALLVEFPPYVQVDRCVFDGADLSVQDGTLAVRDSTLNRGSIQVLRGYLLADDVTIDGGGLGYIRERGSQPGYLNRLSIASNPGSAAITLRGWNFFLGPDNVLENNLFPVTLTGGMLAGSTVPVTGNINNAVDAVNGAIVGSSTWSALDVPYRVDGTAQTAGAITIEPGAVIEYAADSWHVFYSHFRAYGRPEAPITFRGAGGATWTGITFAANTSGPAFKHCIIEDAQYGINADDTPSASMESCLFRNNMRGVNASTFGVMTVHKSRFETNMVGARETANGAVLLNDPANPNSFEENTLGVDGSQDSIDARNCWWGDPSGPQHASNPGGGGDPASGSAQVVPFLTAPPDPNDHPPIVRMMRPASIMETGSKVILTWEAEDDGAIAGQRVLFSQHGNHGFSIVADDLRPSQRSYELVVPVVNPSSSTSPTFFRVEATDDAGQTGFDEYGVFVPFLDDVTGSLTPITYEGPFAVGQSIPICWTVGGGSGTINAALLFDGDDGGAGLGGAHTGVECLSSFGTKIPWVSTDTARVRLSLGLGAGGRTAFFFSNEFEIRPDERLGDEPPVIDVAPVSAGAVTPCGVTIPITWTASDDEALRSFNVQASYDDGRTWHMIARDLPAGARHFDWLVTPIDGIPNVRVRVIARDLRFQTRSGGAENTFAIPPLPGIATVVDIDGDCVVGFNDLLFLLAAWGPCSGACPADLDGNGVVDFVDLLTLLAYWS